jgi:23S rRNA (adenine2503-C2)-methyltransferase
MFDKVLFILSLTYLVSNTVSFSGLLMSKSLLTQSFDELTQSLEGSGRAKRFWENLREGYDPSTDLGDKGLSVRVRDRLKEEFLYDNPLIPAEIVKESLASCGTRKLLLSLQDGQSIESVLIPSYKHDRTTLCVSTQIGCDRGCRFCLTGTMGLSRNLSSTEIISQVIHGMRVVNRESMPALTNVVFMGMVRCRQTILGCLPHTMSFSGRCR